MKTFQAHVKCRKLHNRTCRQHAESNTSLHTNATACSPIPLRCTLRVHPACHEIPFFDDLVTQLTMFPSSVVSLPSSCPDRSISTPHHCRVHASLPTCFGGPLAFVAPSDQPPLPAHFPAQPIPSAIGWVNVTGGRARKPPLQDQLAFGSHSFMRDARPCMLAGPL